MLKNLQSLREGGWKNLLKSFWLFFGYLLSQVGVQLINMVTGFLIIRAMSKDDYANFTIITTLAPVMLLLSDNGIGGGISAIGRKIWEDNEKVGRLVSTGFQLRRTFALGSFLLIGPLLCWMLVRNHTDYLTIGLLLAITLTGVSFELTSTVLKMIMQLRQQIKTLAKVSISSSILRLCMIICFVTFFHLNTVMASAAAASALILEATCYIWVMKSQISWGAPPDPEYRSTIYAIVRKTAPLTIYYCVQGQISIWLISVFGSAHQVADIGATARFGIIFATLTSTYSTIVVPRFARNNGRRRLFVQFLQIVCSLALLLVVCVAVAWFFPEPFILLLGPKYSNMSGILWLVMLSAGMNSLAGLIYGMNIAKGWIPPAILTIPVEVATQIILIMSLNLSKTENVLTFSCLAAIPPAVITSIMLLRRIRLEPEL